MKLLKTTQLYWSKVMIRLAELSNVSRDEMDLPLFNHNFKNVMLLSHTEFKEVPMLGPVLTHNLESMLDDANLQLASVDYVVCNPDIAVFVFNDYSSFTVTLDGSELKYLKVNNDVMTWVRIQKIYYDDVKHLTSHSKRAPITSDTKTLTLDQMLNKRKTHGRLLGILRKSRR